MSANDDIERLQRRIDDLTSERDSLLDMAEDVHLIANFQEKLQSAEDVYDVLSLLIEYFGIVKEVSYCAYLEKRDDKIKIGKEYNLKGFKGKIDYIVDPGTIELFSKVQPLKKLTEMGTPKKKGAYGLFPSPPEGEDIQWYCLVPIRTATLKPGLIASCIYGKEPSAHEGLSSLLERLVAIGQSSIEKIELLACIEDLNNRLRSRLAEKKDELKIVGKERSLFRGLLDRSGEAIFIIDPDTGRFLDVNERALTSLGYQRDELIGKKVIHIEGIFPREIEWIDHVKEVREKGAVLLEGIHRRKDGSTFPVEVNVTYIRGPDMDYMVALARDITERKAAEALLAEKESFLSRVFSSIQDGISVLDKDSNILTVNDTMERWYPHESPLKGKKCYKAYHGRDTKCTVCPAQKTLQTGGSAHETVPKRDSKGRIIGWLDLFTFPLTDSDKGELKGVIEYVRDITERKKAEDALRVSEKKYRDLVNNSIVGVFQTNLLGEILYVNDAMVKIAGFESAEEMQKVGVLFGYKDSAQRNHLIKELEEKGRVDNYELGMKTRLGEDRVLMTSMTLNRDKINGVMQDITQRKKAEDELRRHADEQAVLLKVSRVLSSSLALEDVLQNSIDTVVELTGLDTGAIYLFKEDGLLHLKATTPALPEDFPDELRHLHLKDHPHIKTAIENGKPLFIDDTAKASLTKAEKEVTALRGLRTLLYVPLKRENKVTGIYIVGSIGRPRRNLDSQIHLNQAIASQITLAIENSRLFADIIKAEKDLNASEERLRTVLDNVDEIIYSVEFEDDPLGGKVTLISGRTKEITGYSGEDFIKKPELWMECIHPEDMGSLKDSTFEILGTKDKVTRRYRFRKRNGCYIWLEDGVVPKIDDKGNVKAFFGVARDVTERKAAEEALRESEEKFSKAFFTSPDSITMSSVEDGLFVEVNEGFLSLTGYERDEVIGKTGEELGIWANPDERAQFIQKMLPKKGIENYEAQFRMKDGSIRTGIISAKLISMGGKEVILAITRNITERKKMESALEESEEKYRSLMETSSDLVFVLEKDSGRIMEVNDQVIKVLGYSSDEIIGSLSGSRVVKD